MELDFAPRPHKEAEGLIAGKKVVAREVFYKLLPELRARAFTISGVECANVMQRVRDSIAALPRGGEEGTWDKVKEKVVAELDPWLGDGAERRATLLLRAHGFQAFQASNWRVAQEDEDTTHLQYLATEDDRVRESHLALNGVTLPKGDPFWDKHYPPWDWGCRCRVRPMNPDLVDMEREEDLQRAPEERNVIEGPALEQLRNGTLMREGRRFDVTAPAEKGFGKENTWQWHPDDLRLTAEELKGRYEPEVWNGFEEWAKQAKVSPRVTVWKWINPPAKAQKAPAAVAAVEPEPVTREFPEALGDLEKVRGLGGSTGAELMRDRMTGKQFVVKRGNSAEHVREEFAADEVYRAAGAKVPRARMLSDSAGNPVKVAEFVEGRNLAEWLKGASAEAKAKVFRQLQEHLHVDALVGNWDVAGAGLDNILVDRDGNAWRIDNGGALRYRAQGAAKTAEEWGEHPVELWTLRDGKVNAQTAEVFKGADIYGLAERIGKTDFDAAIAAAPEEVRGVLKARARTLKDVGRKALEYRDSSFRAGHADRVTEEIVRMRKGGVSELLGAPLKQSANKVELRDEHGRAFDNLRSSGTGRQAAAVTAQSDPSEYYWQKILPAVKTVNHHHAAGDTNYGSGKLAEMNAVKMELAHLANSTTNAAEKAMAVKYLQVIAQVNAAAGKKDVTLPKVDKVAVPTAAKKPAKDRTAVQALRDFIEARGGDWDVVANWADAQGGSSGSVQSRRLKRWLYERLQGVKTGDFREVPEASLLSGMSGAEREKYDRSFEVFHAFVQEVLAKTAFPGNDQAAGLVRLLRVETTQGAVKFGPGESGVYKRGLNESASLYTWFSSGTKTVTAVPHVRCTSIYFLERTPGVGNTFLYGDSENEVTYMAHGLRTKNVTGKTVSDSPGTDHTQWESP